MRMETTTGTAGDFAPLSREAQEADRRIEVFLDQELESEKTTGLAASGLAGLSTVRPFAPWEVRNARNWRFPLLAGAGLVGSSLFVGLAPLWRLGPGTAAVVWFDLVGAAFLRPLSALANSLPLLARAASAVGAEEGLLSVPLLLVATATAGLGTWMLARGLGRGRSLQRSS
jgi:hypothetical protein